MSGITWEQVERIPRELKQLENERVNEVLMLLPHQVFKAVKSDS